MDTGNNLVWIDLEMTGLNPDENCIIEIAVVITDSNLNPLEDTLNFAIHQNQEELDKMDAWNQKQHNKSGLVKRVQESSISIKEAEKMTLKFIKKYSIQGKSPLCGNSVHMDRSFLNKYMPKVIKYLHYRNIDVSSFKEVIKRWYHFDLYEKKSHKDEHLALADIIASIDELKYYQEHFFKTNLHNQ